MNKRFVFLFLAFIIPVISNAIHLSGKAVSYLGSTLVVFTEEDYISHKRKVLGQCVIGRDGEFALDFEITETREIMLVINSVEGILYVEPGKDYVVNFPAFIPDQTVKKFDKISVDLAIQNLPEDDLNFLIRNFNWALSAFVNEHYMDFATDKYRGSETFKASNGKILEETGMLKPPCKDCPGEEQDPKEVGMNEFGNNVEEFRVNVDESMGKYMGNEFFKDYVNYNIVQLELASGMKKQMLLEEHFFSQPFRHNNPAYVDCFNMFYREILPKAAEGEYRDSMYKFVNSWKDHKMLSRFLIQRNDMAAEHVRYMTMIVGLRDLIYNRSILQDGIESILSGIARDQKDAQVAATAANVLESLHRNQTGWKLEDFTLTDHKGSSYTLSEHQNQYTYIFFYAEWCSACLKELQIMEKLQETYGKEIKFVAISMDDKPETMREHVLSNRGQNWTFLYGPTDPLIREKFGLRALPGAYLVDPEGKLMKDHAPRPSEGVAKEMDRIKARVNKPATDSNAPKTWK